MLFDSFFGVFLDVAIHINSIGPFEEVKESKLSHIVVIVLSDSSKGLEYIFEFIHLFENVDIARVNVKQ